MTRAASNSPPRRQRVPGERNFNIYFRLNAAGRKVYEVGFKENGAQKFETVYGGLTAARARRDDILGKKARGERVSSNRRLTFAAAADRWLADQVSGLRPATQAIYRNAIDNHLRRRWGRRRLDQISPDDAARLIRELRAEGLSEHSIDGIVHAARRVFKFADRRLDWYGRNPIERLEKSERPKLSSAPRRRLFEGDELGQTLAAASEPWRTIFALASVTGARLSEILGLVWADLDLAELENATVRFEFQVSRSGKRTPLKTEESRRVVEIPSSLAGMLAAHRVRSRKSQDSNFVFASRSGRALSQRNVLRALRVAMRNARTEDGPPTFPPLHAVDPDGEPLPVRRGSVPSFHSFRHTAASVAIRDGESAEEVSWQLGHRNSNITRAVYVQEIKDAERRARRRAKMEERYGGVLAAADSRVPQRDANVKAAEVVDLGTKRRETK